MRILVPITILLTLSGCSSIRDRPTLERMDDWFKKVKYVETFESKKTPEELLSAVRNSACQSWNTTSTGTAVIGPNAYAPVSATVRFSIDTGVFSTGGVWGGLNADSLASYEVVMSFKAFPSNGGSTVEVAPVKKGMVNEVKNSIEVGKLFCNWRRFSDPWRM